MPTIGTRFSKPSTRFFSASDGIVSRTGVSLEDAHEEAWTCSSTATSGWLVPTTTSASCPATTITSAALLSSRTSHSRITGGVSSRKGPRVNESLASQ